MRVAYADPPYVGLAHRYPEKEEIDHRKLIDALCRDFPDGWALSCKANSVRDLWPMCPPDTRLGIYAKTWTAWVSNVRPAYSWEGVLFRGGRVIPDLIERDWITTAPPVNQRVLGTKPEMFCYWLFRILGLQPDDELVDIYPGSNAVTNAWHYFRRQLTLPLADGAAE